MPEKPRQLDAAPQLPAPAFAAAHGSGQNAGQSAGQSSGHCASQAPGANRRYISQQLFGNLTEVEIQHGESVYRLRLTSLGKLILTK